MISLVILSCLFAVPLALGTRDVVLAAVDATHALRRRRFDKLRRERNAAVIRWLR